MKSKGRRSVLLAGAAAGAFLMVMSSPVAANADTHYYPVAPGYALNVRSGPGTGYSIVRVLAEGSHVPIFCQTPSEYVTGPYGTTKIWDSIGVGEYVSDAHVKTGSDGYIAPRCA
jgi:uncharacterized protein YraI